MLNTKQFDKDELSTLVQRENFAGWVYSIDYEKALIITNDKWKSDVKGIPHNCFLIATSFDPRNYGNTAESDKEVVLLRVIGTCKLPQDDDMIKTKIDNYQNKIGVYSAEDDEFDKITRNKLQFGGLECRVLGTFYMKNNQLNLGSDIETFFASLQTRVYVPTKEALGKIVNFVDPIRKNKSKEDFKMLGIDGDVEPFPIGTVRYTSTDRMHRATNEDKVPFCIQPADFLARRTAVLGMTRTGKSNMIKQTVSVVKKISSENNLKIGQLIFDINGEYANANQQDNGSISDIFKGDCVKYRMVTTSGFEPLLNNFYEEIQDGLFTIQNLIKERGEKAADIDTFSNMSLERPDDTGIGELKRWAVKISLYKTLLHKAGYTFAGRFNVKFEANKKIREKVDAVLQADNDIQVSLNPSDGFDFLTSEKWFLAARSINKDTPLKSSGGGDWFDTECTAMLNLLAMKNATDTWIKGYRTVSIAKDYHSPKRNGEVCKEIFDSLLDGKIVILDLSVGNALLRERISKKIASHIFNASMGIFTDGMIPPNIIIYIEEAHNLIGKGMDLTETWPRLAKEGAKYKIALVYATQEVSSVHKNILANTENWFVSHLNSDIEIRELAHFYDFSDFSKSLLKSQDVGFTRVKTLSSPYVVPVQIDKFEPDSFTSRGEENE